MGEVTILFRDNSQPIIIADVNSIEIKFDVIRVNSRGYNKIYFKDVVKSLSSTSDVKIFIK